MCEKDRTAVYVRVKMRSRPNGQPAGTGTVPDAAAAGGAPRSGTAGAAGAGAAGKIDVNGLVDQELQRRADALKKKFEEQGTEGAPSTQAEMAKLLKDDFSRYGKLAKEIGISVD